MKIAFVYPFPLAIGQNKPRLPGNFGVGGGEMYSFKVAMKLAEHGHDVTFFTGLFPGIRKNPMQIGRLKIVYLPIKIWKGFAQYAMMPSLLPSLLSGGFDIVHSWQFPTAYTFVSGVAAKLRGTKFFVSHVGMTPGTSRSTKIFSRMNRGLVDKVIALTDYGKRYYRGYVHDRKLEVIYPGIDTDVYFHERSRKIDAKFRGKRVILYAGRLIPSKGVDYIIRALPHVLKKYPNAVFVVIGQGHIKADLERMAEELGVRDKVFFTGYVEDADMRKYYSRADVFVLPPVYKDSWGGRNAEPGGFGLVLAEAMVCDTPVVSTRVDTIPYWIKDGHNGFLCEPNDAVGLARKINLVFGNKRVRDRVVETAKKIVYDRYTLEKVADQLEEIYGV